MLEVKWSSTPGAKLTRLSHKVLSNRIGCTCHKGLYMVRAPTLPALLGIDGRMCVMPMSLLSTSNAISGGIHTWECIQLENFTVSRKNCVPKEVELVEARGAARRAS
jgi:hypothetical protein